MGLEPVKLGLRWTAGGGGRSPARTLNKDETTLQCGQLGGGQRGGLGRLAGRQHSQYRTRQGGWHGRTRIRTSSTARNGPVRNCHKFLRLQSRKSRKQEVQGWEYNHRNAGESRWCTRTDSTAQYLLANRMKRGDGHEEICEANRVLQMTQVQPAGVRPIQTPAG
jgi:hypothetical protein